MVSPFESPLEGMLFDCLAMNKEELKQKKIVYIFIKQVSSMRSKNQVFCPYAIYVYTIVSVRLWNFKDSNIFGQELT